MAGHFIFCAGIAQPGYDIRIAAAFFTEKHIDHPLGMFINKDRGVSCDTPLGYTYKIIPRQTAFRFF